MSCSWSPGTQTLPNSSLLPAHSPCEAPGCGVPCQASPRQAVVPLSLLNEPFSSQPGIGASPSHRHCFQNPYLPTKEGPAPSSLRPPRQSPGCLPPPPSWLLFPLCLGAQGRRGGAAFLFVCPESDSGYALPSTPGTFLLEIEAQYRV